MTTSKAQLPGGRDDNNCKRCKTSLVGLEGVVRNGTGGYCAPCWAVNRALSVEGLRRARAERRGKCQWCGTAMPADVPVTVCSVCKKNNVWLLACIRSGPHAARYVASAEIRELPDRLARDVAARAAAEAQRREAQKAVQLPLEAPAPTPDPTPSAEERLRRLEEKLDRLLSSLGE